jgi:hypothetical protein
VFEIGDSNSISTKLAELKTSLLEVVHVIYDIRSTERVYTLWDDAFKALYKSNFRKLNYTKS